MKKKRTYLENKKLKNAVYELDKLVSLFNKGKSTGNELELWTVNIDMLKACKNSLSFDEKQKYIVFFEFYKERHFCNNEENHTFLFDRTIVRELSTQTTYILLRRSEFEIQESTNAFEEWRCKKIIEKYRNNDTFKKFDIFNNAKLLIVDNESYIIENFDRKVIVEGLLDKYIPDESTTKKPSLHNKNVRYNMNNLK